MSLLIFCVLVALTGAFPVNMTELSDLTFVNGGYTTSGERGSIPQIQFRGGGAVSHNQSIQWIQCHNDGTSPTGDVAWKCSMSYVGETSLKLQDHEISCDKVVGRSSDIIDSGSCIFTCTLQYAFLDDIYYSVLCIVIYISLITMGDSLNYWLVLWTMFSNKCGLETNTIALVFMTIVCLWPRGWKPMTILMACLISSRPDRQRTSNRSWGSWWFGRTRSCTFRTSTSRW